MSKILYPNSIRIGLMDPSIAQTWAQRILSDGTTVGSIKKGDTINHTTSQPIATGLFCQRIFGPCIDYTCACGHEKIRIGFNPNIAPPVCPECHVEWTHASVRRQFLGSIDLISPVTHKWFSDSRGAYIPTLLGITPKTFRNLKECKLFFPFDFKKSQEAMHYRQNEKKKKKNALNYREKVPLIVRKDLVNTFRAMHSLQLLIDPQKPRNPHFLQNFQLTKNLRGFWFLSNKLLKSGNTSIENLFSKISDASMLASGVYFPSTVLAYSRPKGYAGSFLSPPVSYKYSIATKTFGKQISFQNHKKKTNLTKLFSSLQTKTLFYGEKERSSKDKNFDSLIAATQWLTIEQAFLVKEKITKLFVKKAKKPVRSILSSKHKDGAHVYNFEKKTNNLEELKLSQKQVKKQNSSVLARSSSPIFADQASLETSLTNTKALQNLLVVRRAKGRVLAQRVSSKVGPKNQQEAWWWHSPSLPYSMHGLEEPTFGPIKGQSKAECFGREATPQNFKNDNIIFDWKAKSLLRGTNRGQKKKPSNNLNATFAPQQDHFPKKINLKYVFVLAEKIENNLSKPRALSSAHPWQSSKDDSSIFSENFSTLALQNKQVSLNSKLQSQTVLNTEEKKTILANFYEDVRQIKSQSKIKAEEFPALSDTNPETLTLCRAFGKTIDPTALPWVTRGKETPALAHSRHALWATKGAEGFAQGTPTSKAGADTGIERQNSKTGIKSSSLISRNGTYIFRDFIKYKKEKNPDKLFGKNKRPSQLLAFHSTNSTQFALKFKKIQRISNYKIGLCGNSKIGLCMTLSPFTFNLLLPKKNTGNRKKRSPFISLFSESNKISQWLIKKDKESLFSYLDCSFLLRTTGTKLWYLQEKERLTSFVLKAFFYGFKTNNPTIQENLKETGSLKKTFNKNLFKAFNFSSFCPKNIYLINFLSNQSVRQPQNNEFQEPTPDDSYQFFLKTDNGFAKHHNFPIRPSYTQPEDYRRQFLKFLGNNSLIENTDVPIFRYQKKHQLTNKRQTVENLVKHPLKAKSNRNFISPQAIEVYFSEAKSVAKEQTIKKILSQTGGGGLQTCLELVNLSELVLILQNDLSEIAPRLSKSQSTRRVLLSIINDTSNNLTETLFLLRKSTNKKKLLLSNSSANQEKVSMLPLAQQEQLSPLLFNNEQEDYSSEIKSVDFKLQDKGQSVLETTTKTLLDEDSLFRSSTNSKVSPQIKLTDDARHTLPNFSARETKETYYPNHILLNDKIEVLEKKCKEVKKEYKAVKKICSDFQNRKNAHKRRYKLAFQLLRTMSNPAGMTMSSVPVLPPGLRPIIDVPKIGPITADLNIRYRSLLFALRNLRELAYVDFRNAGAAQASVQEAVDDLLYTGGKTRREKSSSQNPNLYKSLAMRLKGKHGRFRGNLLGKRVDYSGRSVIVVGPTLKIHQCGLPFEIAIKLFNPFLIRSLIQRGFCKNVYKAKQILIRGKFKPLIWTLCQEVMSEHLVLLNRAPTLHRLGVQAFMPVLISGRAILLHPLVCTGFNADFDGDQMGVHVPLFPQARAEAWKMMWSRNNFLLPSSGEPVLLPSQDMVLGCYYLTCSTQKVLQTALESPKYNSLFPFSILNQKIALNRYAKGTYTIQSIVWISPNKTTFFKSEVHDLQDQRAQKKYTSDGDHTHADVFTKGEGKLKPLPSARQSPSCVSCSTSNGGQKGHGGYGAKAKKGITSWNQEIPRTEDDGLVALTLELRITPFGIMRLVYTGGIKSFSFQNSLLLPGRQAGKPPVFAVVVRTTIGRLIFNNLLEEIKAF